ncbi:hypothetical protein MSSD1_314 [Mycoplasmopsis synoviae]
MKWFLVWKNTHRFPSFSSSLSLNKFLSKSFLYKLFISKTSLKFLFWIWSIKILALDAQIKHPWV